MVDRLIQDEVLDRTGTDAETADVQAEGRERIADIGVTTFSRIDALRIQADALKAAGRSRMPFMGGLMS